MQENRIYYGDVFQIIKIFPNASMDAIITDPPFGIGFNYDGKKDVADNSKSYWSWFGQIYNEMNRILKPGGFIAIWQTQLYFKYFWEWFGEDIHIYAGCKNFVQIRKTPINYGYDPIIMRYKDGIPLRPLKPKRNLDFFVANTAKFITQTESLARQHPCPRPIDQAEEIVRNFVIEGGLILNPFSGSGTICLAAMLNSRRFIGIEIEQRYCNLAQKRIDNVRGNNAKGYCR